MLNKYYAATPPTAQLAHRTHSCRRCSLWRSQLTVAGRPSSCSRALFPFPVTVPCSCGWAYHISKPTNLTIFSLMCAGHGKGIHRHTQEYTGLLAEYSLYLTFILFAVPLRILAIAIVHNPHFVTFVEILLFLCFVCMCLRV